VKATFIVPHPKKNTSPSVKISIESASPLSGDVSILPDKQAVVNFEQGLGIFEKSCRGLNKFEQVLETVGGALSW
jgi:hypothetical protein